MSRFRRSMRVRAASHRLSECSMGTAPASSIISLRRSREDGMPATFLRGRESLSAISLAVASMNAPADMTEPETCALMAIDESSEPSRFRTDARSEEHTSELQSQSNLVCRLLLEKKKKQASTY